MENHLVIVTDLGQFKAYRYELTPKKTPRLELLEGVCWDEAHQHFDELVTDMAGRRAGATQRGWGAPITDDHNLKLENERRLIKRISTQIEALIQRAGRAGVWFAAPKEINQRILEELHPGDRAHILKSLPADLVWAHPTAVLQAFRKTALQAAHT